MPVTFDHLIFTIALAVFSTVLRYLMPEYRSAWTLLLLVSVAGMLYAVRSLYFPKIVGLYRGVVVSYPYGAPIIAGLIVVVLVVVLIGSGWWFLREPPEKKQTVIQQSEARVEQEKVIPEPLFKSQLQELRELEQFLGQKDEMGLRELFDFPNLLRFNLVIARMQLAGSGVTEKERSDALAYFSDGQGFADRRFLREREKAEGVMEVSPIPGAVGLLKISKKYIDSKKQLSKFLSSIQLPTSVRDTVSEFDKAVGDDLSMFFDVFNEKLQQDPNYVLHDHDMDSPYGAVTTNDYWHRFVNLKPKAEKVIETTRAYLKID